MPDLKDALLKLIYDPARKQNLKDFGLENYVFHSEQGGLLDVTEINRLLKAFGKKAGPVC